MDANGLFRYGGTLGIIVVVLYVVATQSGYTAPSGTHETVVFTRDFLTRLAIVVQHIFTPLLSLVPLYAFYRWMRNNKLLIAPFVYHVGLIGLILWIAAGVLFFASIRQPDSETELINILNRIGYSLFDGAYLVLAIHSGLGGYAMQKLGRIFTSRVGYVVCATVTPIMLFGAFEDTNILVIYAYGTFPSWMFFLSAALLRHADQLATSNSL